MKRSSPLQRRTTLPRSSTPMERGAMTRKRRSKAEQAAKHLREYGGEGKRAFVASLPCIVPGCPNPSQAAHVVRIDGGMGLKGTHKGLAPVCHLHHSADSPHALHTMGPRTFERLHGLDLAECARRTDALYQQHLAGLTHISAIVPGVVARLRGEA